MSLKNEDGIALPMVIILIIVGTILVAALLAAVRTHMNTAVHEESMSQAFHSAEAGVEYIDANISDVVDAVNGINDGNYYMVFEDEGNIVFKDIDNGEDKYLGYNVFESLDDIEFKIELIENDETFKLGSTGEYNDYNETIVFELKPISSFAGTVNASTVDIGNYDHDYFDIVLKDIGESDFHNQVNVTYHTDMDKEDWKAQADDGDIFVKEDKELSFGEIKYEDFDFDDSFQDVDHWLNHDSNWSTDHEIYDYEYELEEDKFIELGEMNIGNEEIKISSNSGNSSETNTLHLYIKGDEFKIEGNGRLVSDDNTFIVVYFNNDLELEGTIESEIFFYGPDSGSRLRGNASFTGSIVADRVDLDGNAKITPTPVPDGLLSNELVDITYMIDNWSQILN